MVSDLYGGRDMKLIKLVAILLVGLLVLSGCSVNDAV